MKHKLLALALLASCGSPGDPPDSGADAGTDASPGSPDGSVGPDAMEQPEKNIFDESRIWTYEITVAPDQLAWLNENALLEQYVPVEVAVDGEVYPQAAMRYKGSFGTLHRCFTNGERNDLCAKLSIKLSFNEYDSDGKYHGVKKLNFHSMLSDMSLMHEAIGYKLFRDMGVAAPRTTYAKVIVNGENLGLFSVIENIDGRFARDRFNADGNIYKDAWPTGDNADAEHFERALNTNEGSSVDRFVRFSTAINAAGDSGFRDTIESWTDTDQLVGYFAVARLIEHWDDVTTWYCFTPTGKCVNHNYSWYESPTEDRVTLIPWDLDHTFEDPNPIREMGMPDWDDVEVSCEWFELIPGAWARAPACDPFLRRIVIELWPEYEALSMQLIEGPFSAPAMDARVQELKDLLNDAVKDDPFLVYGDWEWNVGYLRDSIDVKRDYIEAKF